MSIKLIAPLTIVAAGLFVAACGEEQQLDVGSSDRPPAVAAYPEGYPVTADGAIRRELAKLEAERARRDVIEITPRYGSADSLEHAAASQITPRYGSADSLEHAASTTSESWGGYPLTADGAIRRELAKLEAERAAG
jgi:hypothetical protein